MLKCDHCLLEMTEEKAVPDTINGQKKLFCCHGCKGVYRLINEEELGEFYAKRDSSWIPGPPDEGRIDISAFADIVKQTGNESEIDLFFHGIRCASCVWLIERMLLKTEGVKFARLNYATHKAKIRWDSSLVSLEKLLKKVNAIGYTPKLVTRGGSDEFTKARRDLLLRFGTAAFFSMQLMVFSTALYAGYFQGIASGTRTLLQLLSLLLATPILFYSGSPFIRGSITGLRNLNFNMDLLIVTGAGSAYLYSIYQIFIGGEVYFDTSAMIITLILLGRYIETGAKARASEVITRLLSLSPKETRLVIRNIEGREGSEKVEMVPVTDIKEGDLILIKPGERVPLDGTVTEGSSEVDESPLTGESRPVSKHQGSEVFSGTQNLYGSFVFEVKRRGEDTVLSHIIKTVEDAQARRAPVQALADRVVGYFVPAVLTLSFITAVFWLFSGSALTVAVMNAVSVLVIACPCALGLATPLAILTGTTRGASKGIFIKGGDVIERAKDIDTVVLDKTGTITEGKPELAAFKGLGISDNETLCLASSLELLSEHSIGKAIVAGSAGMQAYIVSDFAAYPGRGVKGYINGKPALIGNKNFIESEGVDDMLSEELTSWVHAEEDSGRTAVYLSYDGKIAGIFIISDTIRGEARETVKEIEKTGSSVLMITGDDNKAALSVAKEAGISEDNVAAQKSPSEKAEEITVMQGKGRHVMMVGDGINDAPALVQADIGVAMGRATDIALESSDIVLMRNDLRMIPETLRLSKATYNVIRQNLFWALIYNLIAVPLAIMGMLHPIVAAIAMSLSSLSVVGNSMRLKRT
ncbi:MAG: heavy metal translocating P-type ATPase [Nitrospirae bacterium]|nr:heavy metal translocating P-type ATPase [Nitrospirota bacterium]